MNKKKQGLGEVQDLDVPGMAEHKDKLSTKYRHLLKKSCLLPPDSHEQTMITHALPLGEILRALLHRNKPGKTQDETHQAY